MFYMKNISVFAKSLALIMTVTVFASCNGKLSQQTESDTAVGEVSDKTENNNDNAESVANITTDDFIVLVSDFRTNPDEWNFKGTRPVVIDFYATWCGPCRKMAPIFEKVAAMHSKNVDFFRVDIDQEKELANYIGIEAIPTLMFIPVKGKPTTIVGEMDEESLSKKIKELL